MLPEELSVSLPSPEAMLQFAPLQFADSSLLKDFFLSFYLWLAAPAYAIKHLH